MKKIILNLIPVLLLGCEPFPLAMDYANGLEITNKSNHYIGLYVGCKEYEAEYIYPDTLLPSMNTNIKYDISTISQPGIGLPKKQINFFKTLPKDTLSIFIFHTDTLNKYPWEKVRDEYKILKRYDLSYEDCKMLKYKVPYPPSPEMANMKMYPKYGK